MKLILGLLGGFVGLGMVVYIILRVLAAAWRAYECIELSDAIPQKNRDDVQDDPTMWKER